MQTTPGVWRRTLRPFGASLEIEADDPRVLDACDAALAHFPPDAGAGGALRVRATTGADGPADPAWPETAVERAAGRLRLRCGSAVLDVDAPAGTAEVTLPPSLLAVPDAVRTFVEGAVWTLLIEGGRLHAVHAGLVEHAGRGLVLRGPSGAGKSTLAYACLRAGLALASDDWVYAVVGRPPDHLWGYPWRLFLVPEAAARFPELAGATPVPHPGADRRKVPVEPPADRQRTGAPVDAVVLLDPAPELALTPIGLPEARRRFWASALPTERTGLPAPFVDALLARPCYLLQRGTDPDAAAALLRELVSSS